ncbi:hypothetical protein UFO1_4153 [Pelosinus sp. UFO1]|nr:hypothetical protein UFO1_4153 [Pelosinus sp. UFO1]
MELKEFCNFWNGKKWTVLTIKDLEISDVFPI